MVKIEIRGFFYQALVDIFPTIGELLKETWPAGLEGIRGDGWYDIEPYHRAREFITAHVSPVVLNLIGARLVEFYREELTRKGIKTGRDLARALPALYREWVRGDPGEWEIREVGRGRAVVRYTGEMISPDITAGVFKGALETVGAYNVRVTVLESRPKGAPFNEWLVEWLEGNKAD